MPDLELFDFVKNLFTKDKAVRSNEHQPPPATLFIVNRFLGYNTSSFYVADEVNCLLGKVPAWAMACLLYHRTPLKKKAPYIDYLKKEKETHSKEKEAAIVKLGEIYCCRPAHAEQILSLLEAQGIKAKNILGGRSEAAKRTKSKTSLPSND